MGRLCPRGLQVKLALWAAEETHPCHFHPQPTLCPWSAATYSKPALRFYPLSWGSRGTDQLTLLIVDKVMPWNINPEESADPGENSGPDQYHQHKDKLMAKQNYKRSFTTKVTPSW